MSMGIVIWNEYLDDDAGKKEYVIRGIPNQYIFVDQEGGGGNKQHLLMLIRKNFFMLLGRAVSPFLVLCRPAVPRIIRLHVSWVLVVYS